MHMREKLVDKALRCTFLNQICRADDKKWCNTGERKTRIRSLRKEIYELRARDRECWQK